MEVEMWWDNLWMSDEERAEIKESLKKEEDLEVSLCGEHILKSIPRQLSMIGKKIC